jgi:hypothetical protein
MSRSHKHGIAAVTGCGSCWTAAGISRGEEYEPGRFLTVVHASCVSDLEAKGWTLIPHGMYGDGVDDAVCSHLAAEVV